MFKRNLFHKRKSLKFIEKYDFKENFDLNLRVEELELEDLVNLFEQLIPEFINKIS